MSQVRLADFIQALKVELGEAQRREVLRRAQTPLIPGQKLPSLKLVEAVIEMTVEASVRETFEGSVGAGKAVEFFVTLGSKAQRETSDRTTQKVVLKLEAFEGEFVMGEVAPEPESAS